MSTALLTAVGRVDEDRREAAEIEYRELLRNGNASAKNVARMKSILQTLGLSLADASAHLRLYERVEQLRARIRGGAALGDAQEAAAKAIEGSMQEKERMLAEWRLQHNRLILAQSDIGQKYQEAYRAVEELTTLVRTNPLPLGDVEVPSQSDLAKPDPFNPIDEPPAPAESQAPVQSEPPPAGDAPAEPSASEQSAAGDGAPPDAWGPRAPGGE
jgi:hypothetical protein